MYDLLILPLLIFGGQELSTPDYPVTLEMQMTPDDESYCFKGDGLRFNSRMERRAGSWLGSESVWFWDHTSCATEESDRQTNDAVGFGARWRF